MIKKINILLLLILVACSQKGGDSALHPVPALSVAEGTTRGFYLGVYKKYPQVRLEVPVHPQLDLWFIPEKDSLYITPQSGTDKLISIPLFADGQAVELLLRITPMIKHTFSYKPDKAINTVVVMGGFNNWSRSALPLSDADGDGIFDRTVYLKPERHEYKFVVNGEELIDPENPVFISNNIGGWNSILDLSEFQEEPAGQFVKSTQTGHKLQFDFLEPVDNARPMNTYVYFNNQKLHNDLFDPLEDGGVTVNIRSLGDGLLRITGVDEKGRVLPENQTIIKNGQPLNRDSHPDNWHFTVLYSLMIDRFLDGDQSNTVRVADSNLHPLANFHGGDLAGIIQKLKEGYFTDLGISAIWISPVQQQPERAYVESIPPNRKFTGYHGYWPVAPRKIDARYGTAEELKELVDLAHGQDIKIILDFVSNHVHEEHPYFKEHRNWFGQVELPDGRLNIRQWGEETRLTTWFDSFIPSFDYSAAPEAIDQVVDDALWWLETFNLDGFRQDAVKHVPHRFWTSFTAAMKKRFPDKDLYQIGETFGSDELINSYVNPGELSSQFNFAIYFNARGPFSAEQADFARLENIILDNFKTFGPINLMGNITSSHDQVRFMAFADGQLTFGDNGTERAFNDPPEAVRNESSYRKLANFQAFNMTMSGVPVIYYGEEIGLMGAADPGNRRPMRFEADVIEAEQKLLEETARLTRLRRQIPALALGDFIPLHIDGPVWVYAKAYFNEIVLVAFNQSPDKITVTTPLPFSESFLNRFVSTATVPIENNSIHFELEPYSYRFYRLY